MYAAAGGASIANRRKQKRLLLNKRGEGVAAAAAAARTRNALASHSSSKFARPHIVPPTAPIPPRISSSLTTTTTATAVIHRERRRVERHNQLLVPVSPSPFPISPPPLSLESSNSLTYSKSNNFPFPPPSILDLRVSPSTSELQCGGQGPGKAAWQGCNRPSPLPLSPTSPHGSRCEGQSYKTKQCEAHRRWMKRNRIRDASYCYGSSGEEEEDDGSTLDRRRGEVSAAVNTVLYAGLGTTALGLIISFVGTGEKGFQSPELRLVGPSLLCAGLLCCLLRVLLCLCLCHCGKCRWRRPCMVSADKEKGRRTETLAAGPLVTASLLPTAPPQPPPPPQQQQHQHQQATTSSCPVSTDTKGHELLLSPAQLPE